MTSWIQNQNTKQKIDSGQPRWSTKTLNLVLIGLVVGGIFGYLVQVNNSVVNAYRLRDLEHQFGKVKLVNRTLEINNQQQQSVDTVLTKGTALGMDKTSQVESLPVPGGSVALAR